MGLSVGKIRTTFSPSQITAYCPKHLFISKASATLSLSEPMLVVLFSQFLSWFCCLVVNVLLQKRGFENIILMCL